MLNVLLQDAKQNVKSFPSGKMIQYDFFGYDEKTKVIFRPYALQSNAVDFCESNAFSIIDPNIRTISIILLYSSFRTMHLHFLKKSLLLYP